MNPHKNAPMSPKKSHDNVLDQINKVKMVKQRGLSQDERQFLGHVFEELKKSEPIGPNFVKGKNQVVRNFDQQFPHKVAELDEPEMHGETLDELKDLRKQVEQQQKAKYLEFLSEDDATANKSKLEKRKALDVMTKIMDQNIKKMRTEADELLKLHKTQLDEM